MTSYGGTESDLIFLQPYIKAHKLFLSRQYSISIHRLSQVHKPVRFENN